jgi:CubicO group peptidase (beta-lactamase class C family)
VTAELQAQVDAALRRAGRRPGLLVVSATDGGDTAFAARGPLPDPPCAPERAVFEIGSITKVFTSLLLAIAAERGELGVDDPSSSTSRAGPACRCGMVSRSRSSIWPPTGRGFLDFRLD